MKTIKEQIVDFFNRNLSPIEKEGNEIVLMEKDKSAADWKVTFSCKEGSLSKIKDILMIVMSHLLEANLYKDEKKADGILFHSISNTLILIELKTTLTNKNFNNAIKQISSNFLKMMLILQDYYDIKDINICLYVAGEFKDDDLWDLKTIELDKDGKDFDPFLTFKRKHQVKLYHTNILWEQSDKDKYLIKDLIVKYVKPDETIEI